MSNVGPSHDSVLPPLEPPKAGTSKRTKWLVLALIVLVCGIPSFGLYWFRQYYRVFMMPTSSMEPTIGLEEHFLVDMRYFKKNPVTHGDVVVFDKDNLYLVKRVVALPGDRIEGRDGIIYVNGKGISEPYVQHIGVGSVKDFPFLQNFGPTTLKAGECFVLGDNRDNSRDSRDPDFGPIALTSIIGRPLYILTSKKRDRAWERIK